MTDYPEVIPLRSQTCKTGLADTLDLGSGRDQKYGGLCQQCWQNNRIVPTIVARNVQQSWHRAADRPLLSTPRLSSILATYTLSSSSSAAVVSGCACGANSDGASGSRGTGAVAGAAVVVELLALDGLEVFLRASSRAALAAASISALAEARVVCSCRCAPVNSTSCGGRSRSSSSAVPNGCGTVFKITASGMLTTLHSFDGADGDYPEAGLVQGTDGSFYGTTYSGGATSGNCPFEGCGTVFKITSGGALTTLHSFDGTDGEDPSSGL